MGSSGIGVVARASTWTLCPVDRAEFRFVAVDASGAVWRWVDEDMVWVREPRGPSSEVDEAETPAMLH